MVPIKPEGLKEHRQAMKSNPCLWGKTANETLKG